MQVLKDPKSVHVPAWMLRARVTGDMPFAYSWQVTPQDTTRHGEHPWQKLLDIVEKRRSEHVRHKKNLFDPKTGQKRKAPQDHDW